MKLSFSYARRKVCGPRLRSCGFRSRTFLNTCFKSTVLTRLSMEYWTALKEVDLSFTLNPTPMSVVFSLHFSLFSCWSPIILSSSPTFPWFHCLWLQYVSPASRHSVTLSCHGGRRRINGSTLGVHEVFSVPQRTHAKWWVAPGTELLKSCAVLSSISTLSQLVTHKLPANCTHMSHLLQIFAQGMFPLSLSTLNADESHHACCAILKTISPISLSLFYSLLHDSEAYAVNVPSAIRIVQLRLLGYSEPHWSMFKAT